MLYLLKPFLHLKCHYKSLVKDGIVTDFDSLHIHAREGWCPYTQSIIDFFLSCMLIINYLVSAVLCTYRPEGLSQSTHGKPLQSAQSLRPFHSLLCITYRLTSLCGPFPPLSNTIYILCESLWPLPTVYHAPLTVMSLPVSLSPLSCTT